MKIISLGAGVQSTALYLMSCSGELERADYAIFADTGWEPRAVYDHLGKLKALNEIPIITVSIGNLREDALSGSRFASMPLFAKDGSGTISMLRRQCTREYKVDPIQKKCRELGATAKDPFEVWIGISTDEIQRMKDSRVKYTNHRWPLIEKRIDRIQCITYLKSLGWEAPKSSCIGCPFHDDRYWQKLKTESPDEFADAVDFDEQIRKMPRLESETYLHRSGVPLQEVSFEDASQQDMFLGECDGYCGL